MPETKMLIPMRQSFVLDLIRFSDGSMTPESIGDFAEEQLLNFFERAFDHAGPAFFGKRAIEFYQEYFPEIASMWISEDSDEKIRRLETRKPLVWKEVTIEHGSSVRMHYGDDYVFAKVENGKIVDKDGSFSPSEWASKVAKGTARNAWRDLWFKDPLGKTWVPAQLLRDQARSGTVADSILNNEDISL